jgi:hypothetical protein
VPGTNAKFLIPAGLGSTALTNQTLMPPFVITFNCPGEIFKVPVVEWFEAFGCEAAFDSFKPTLADLTRL